MAASPPLTLSTLSRRCEGLRASWKSYRENTQIDSFVQFAVALSSFAEFLGHHGLSGLSQLVRVLERTALNQFESNSEHPLPAPAMAEMESALEGLVARVQGYLKSLDTVPAQEERRAPLGAAPLVPGVDEEASPPTPRGVLVLAMPQHFKQWQDSSVQFGYYGMPASLVSWEARDELPEAGGVAALLLDVSDTDPLTCTERIHELRQHYVAAKFLALIPEPSFADLHKMLAAGCDFCLPTATSAPAVVTKLLELNSNDEESLYRVLIVDDSVTACQVIQRTLRENGMESSYITRPDLVLDTLRDEKPDLILMDMVMPIANGVETTRVIRQYPQFLSVPIVYVSRETTVAQQVEALRLGGDHFLTKPLNPVILNAVVKSKIERYRALRRPIFHDSLTGLLNHTSSKQQIDAVLDDAIREQTELCVGMVDIDHFKQVNDTYGHPTGDQVIRCMGWMLKQRLRKGDIIGRYGGEEFIVCLPNIAPQQAVQVLDRIRQDFGQIQHPYNDTWFTKTFSCGLAAYPAVGDMESLIKAADEALYKAKHGGRNQVVLGEG